MDTTKAIFVAPDILFKYITEIRMYAFLYRDYNGSSRQSTGRSEKLEVKQALTWLILSTVEY
jgi:hypothetical protein